MQEDVMKYIELITSIAEENGWKAEIDKYSKNKYEIKLSKPLKQMKQSILIIPRPKRSKILYAGDITFRYVGNIRGDM